MSRSFRKTPLLPLTTAISEKEFKRKERKAKRRAEKVAVEKGKEVLPDEKEYGNPWSGPKDGHVGYWKDGELNKKNLSK